MTDEEQITEETQILEDAKLRYIIFGAMLGFAIAFLGGALLFGLLPHLLIGQTLFNGPTGLMFSILCLTVAPAIGALTMFKIGKKRNFRWPNPILP